MSQELKIVDTFWLVDERTRVRLAIARLRALVDAAELAIEEKAPPSPMVGESVAHAGINIACHLAQLAAYLRAEEDRP